MTYNVFGGTLSLTQSIITTNSMSIICIERFQSFSEAAHYKIHSLQHISTTDAIMFHCQ